MICLVKEGCGIRSISRILGISAATVIRKIIRISKSLQKPMILFGKEYEVDEIRTPAFSLPAQGGLRAC